MNPAVQPQCLLHSSFSHSFFFHFPFLAGDIGQLNLPVGMKDLNLAKTGVKGKATSEWVTSHILNMV